MKTSDSKSPLLKVSELHASVEGVEILKGISLTINRGEVHAVMGPNGPGKSTLANIIAGRPEYTITKGTIDYKGNDRLDWDPETRAREGVL